MRIKMVTIVGARPQFIKAAPVSALIRKKFKNRIREILVHTGQHYDRNMSEIFFRQMRIPRPKYHLGIGGGAHGAMTGRMLEKIEKVLQKEKPDVVLVYGDTNSTLAGALAAVKLHIPVAHVEAGLRSFKTTMPEEINRALTDRISTLLFCPTNTAVKNLNREGIRKGVCMAGDVMYDAALICRRQKISSWKLLENIPSEFILATCHRAENADHRENLRAILEALAQIAKKFPVILPLHPRTNDRIRKFGLKHLTQKIRVSPPLPFFEMTALQQAAKLIITDSGGMQKEAFFHKIPCLTTRTETEWSETLVSKANILVGPKKNSIIHWYRNLVTKKWRPKYLQHPYGHGKASQKIISKILRFCRKKPMETNGRAIKTNVIRQNGKNFRNLDETSN